MAEYVLTREEYEALGTKIRQVRPWWTRGLWRIFGAMVLLCMVGFVIYFRQWLFAAVAIAFVIIIRVQERRYGPGGSQRDTFKAGYMKFEVSQEYFRLSSGNNIVQLEYDQLLYLLEYPRCFVVAGLSGFRATIPKEPLSETETATLVGLQAVIPRIAKRMYPQPEDGRPTAA